MLICLIRKNVHIKVLEKDFGRTKLKGEYDFGPEVLKSVSRFFHGLRGCVLRTISFLRALCYRLLALALELARHLG